jgi:hypothetical protein
MEKMIGDDLTDTQQDRTVRVSAAVHPFVPPCTCAIRSMVLPEGPEFRKLPSGPSLTIVRPCFGQNCIKCLAGSPT